MINRFFLAFFAVILTGCASVPSSISSGNFKYASSDVSVTPFGSNYSISTVLDVGNQRVIAKVFAAECEKGFGSLQIEGEKYFERAKFTVVKTGNKKEDDLFNYLCGKGMPIAYSMENKLSEASKQRRDQEVKNYLNQPKTISRPVYVEQPSQPATVQDVTCITNNYPGGSYTNCKPQ